MGRKAAWRRKDLHSGGRGGAGSRGGHGDGVRDNIADPNVLGWPKSSFVSRLTGKPERTFWPTQ